MELARATPEEKEACLSSPHRRDGGRRGYGGAGSCKRWHAKAGALEELMETVKVASLGQITDALFNVGGQYRRNM